MSNRPHFQGSDAFESCKKFAGRFRGEGVNPVNNALNKGGPFTVNRTSVGIYVVTLIDQYVDIIAITTSFYTEIPLIPQFASVASTVGGSDFLDDNGTFTIHLTDAFGAFQDLGSFSSNDWIAFEVTAKDTVQT